MATASNNVNPVLRLITSATPQSLVMWGYLIYYLVVIACSVSKNNKNNNNNKVSDDDGGGSSEKIILLKDAFALAALMSALIGIVLNANGYAAYASTMTKRQQQNDSGNDNDNDDHKASLLHYLKAQWPSAVRLFAIPYAVSSYSGIVSALGPDEFVLIFPKDVAVLGFALGTSFGIPVTLLLLKELLLRK